MSRPYDLEFKAERAKVIERAILNKRITKSQLASKTGYDERTIRNLLSGQDVRDQTVIDICSFLGIEPIIENDIENIACSDSEYGGYLREINSFYEGYFYLYRRSFSEPGRIFRSVLQIVWDETAERFTFSDFYSADPDEPLGARVHTGSVYMSHYTGLIHFVTVYQGSVRMITATKMRQSDGIMRGSIMTQCEDINSFQPTVGPLVLKKLKIYDAASQLTNDICLLDNSSSDIVFAEQQLDKSEERVVKSFFKSSVPNHSL